MLTEAELEKKIRPIIERQENINTYIITLIAKRIKQIGKLLPSDVFKLKRLFEMGADVQLINKKLAQLTELQVVDIKQLIREVALDGYLDTKPYFDYRNKPFIPYKENKMLQRFVESVARQTAGDYVNLSKSQAFMIRDRKNPKKFKPTSIAKTYQSIIDEAIQSQQSGIDYNTAIRSSIKQLVDSGIKYVSYDTPSGRPYTQRLDTAVRRNILDGIRAVNQGMQDIVGEQFGADGKEISVHQYSAPDHEPFQGHQFKNEEFAKLQDNKDFEDLQHHKFKAVDRPIGKLNCRHFTYSIICGFTKPQYTQEQLDTFIERNQSGYTAPNGRHYTMYECSQKQREYELAVRKAKDGQIAAKESGDMELAKQYQAIINKKTKEYKAFSKACGLSEKRGKMTVSGYSKIKI